MEDAKQQKNDFELPQRYDASLAGRIEAKWQQYWREHHTFSTPNPGQPGFERNKTKRYILDMFPFPSGAGLHVGHPRGYIATDVYARYLRMNGHNVLHTMGFDAFGLPAEQYAIETGTHPRKTTEQNIEAIRRQLDRIGLAHDPTRRIATTDVSYVRWTQWIFLQIFNSWYDERLSRSRPIKDLIQEFDSGDRPLKASRFKGLSWSDLTDLEKRNVIDDHRLAYLDEAMVNWCPALGTVLANEEVTNEGRSERGNYPVFKRPLKQWMLRITAYADRLMEELDGVDWPEPIKIMQREWIGKSEGAEIDFQLDLEAPAGKLKVFTTRPDTICGATYIVVSPQHPIVEAVLRNPAPETNIERVRTYVDAASSLPEVDRQAETRETRGVFLGIYVLNPATGQRTPVWVAEYVLMGYGTGAIMAVPAHDDRDFRFATTFGLPIKDVVYPLSVLAMAYFAEHAPAGVGGHSSDLLLEFVKAVVSDNIPPAEFAAALNMIRERSPSTSAEMPSDEAQHCVSNRQPYLQESLELIDCLAASSFDELRGYFASASYFAHMGAPFTGLGFAVNSPAIAYLPTAEAKVRMTEWLAERGYGRHKITFKLRDWLFSRQRYWGEPFPIVYDEYGLPVALPESMLPLTLPELEDFTPESTNDPLAPPRPPLSRAHDWVNVELDLGEGRKVYRREVNTMPQWAGSCWYYLRYLDPWNEAVLCDKSIEWYWMTRCLPEESNQGSRAGGVDLYVGGVEHAVLHLLYARFWHKVLYDLGYVSTLEPFQKLYNQGYVLAAAFKDRRGIYVPASEVKQENDIYYYRNESVTRQWGKMGKSLKNGISPDHICREYGSDTLRLYEMSMGPLNASQPWNPRDIVGLYRFLQRLWRNIVNESSGELRVSDGAPDADIARITGQTILGVRRDIERLALNTAISKLIELNNHLTKLDAVPGCVARDVILLLAPFAPHVCEELWHRLGGEVLWPIIRIPSPSPRNSRNYFSRFPSQCRAKSVVGLRCA
jgi:leucyl-tRNA synthetase